MTDHISITTITDPATGREVQALTLTVAGRTEYAPVSDAWGAAIARLMEDLDRAQKRIAELEAGRALASILDNAEARADD